LSKIEAGDPAARSRLFELVYDELRRLAHSQRRGQRPDETLSTTALVHETYLKLAGSSQWTTRDRGHFFALAARAMRQIVIDRARLRQRGKRGSGKVAVSIDVVDVAAPERADEILALDDALTRLAEADPDLARIVEWRCFGGLSMEEIAQTLEVSDRTVKRYWRAARAFLLEDLNAQGLSS
jgi:RNA polymerase sigma factor (TIGR02999 family)